MSPEQKAEWRRRVSEGTSKGMREWNASRTPEQKAETSRKQSEALLARIFAPRTPSNRFEKGHKGMAQPNTNAIRSLTKVKHSSIKRILREIATDEPEAIRAAILEGINAPPPRSFPYIALAAAYLDGKPTTDGEGGPAEDLSSLSLAELVERTDRLSAQLRAQAPLPALPDIDVTPEPEDQ